MKLQHKIPLFVITVMLIVGIGGVWLIFAAQKRASERQFEETASAITTTILSGIEEDMLRQDTDHIQMTLDKLRDNGSVRDVDVIAADGTIWASTDGGSIGSSSNGDVTQVLDETGSENVFGEPSDEFMTAMEVVPAKESCRSCHDGVTAIAPNEQGNLGVIQADISTSSLRQGLNLGRSLMVGVFGTIFVLVSITIVLLLRRSVLNPLARLEVAADSISRGDYSVRADVSEGNNEISRVANSFNHMVDKVEERTRELVSTNAELEESNRLKSEFLANMSHELRTPLNVIIGFSEVLRDTPADALEDSERNEFCENIISSGYHLLELINDVLDLAKVEAGRMEIEPEEFYVAPVIKDVIATMQPLASKKEIALSLDISDSVSTVFADTNRFRQVMYNLLSNAVKFTPEGGRIEVALTVMGGMLRFSVTDTGIGISPDDQESIFAEFKQVDGSWSRQFEGTGLGLSLTRRFVEMMDGQVWVESELGMGSTFFFTLPLPTEKTLPEVVPSLEEPATAISTPAVTSAYLPEVRTDEGVEMPLVLVVEDDQRTADLIGLWLSQEGYRVDFALDGEEALRKAKEAHPFAVCLDIMLPKRDGWQVLHELKSNPATADTGVIICSALDNPGLGFALGAADYCVKPLSRRHLLDKLKTIQDTTPFKRSKPQVVVADGDPDSAATTIASLERQGFSVLRTSDGDDTKEICLEHNPDAIIIDQLLPGCGCYEVVAFLQEHPITVDIPVIVTADKELTQEELQKLGGHVRKVIRDDDTREQLLGEMFRLEKLQPERARLVDRQTRLFNRRYFDKRLAEELNRIRRYALDLSVLLVSVDQRSTDPAEQIAVVTAMAALLRSNVRAADPLSRFDANSFGILLPETTRDSGFKVARKIVDLIRAAEFKHKGKELEVSVSVAAAGITADTITPVDDVINALQETLQELGSRGGDGAQFYSGSDSR